jgi:4-hydroxybenzoate polyprenyltransferase
MKLSNFFVLIYMPINVKSLINPVKSVINKKPINDIDILFLKQTDDIDQHDTQNTNWQSKLQNFGILTRINKHILPVTILNFMNGIITDPTHISNWIFSSNFWLASIMVHLITSGSMVINDLYDIKVDTINNPTRPLVTGAVNKQEATLFASILFSIYIFLGKTYIPESAESIWKFSMFAILFYTPVLKRIPFVKNIVCSSIISLTVPFIGLSIDPSFLNNMETMSDWIPLTVRTLFINSIFIEVLLDILDRAGDEKSGVITIPVLIGPEKSLHGLTSFLLMNFFYSIFLCLDPNTGGLYTTMFFAILSTYLPLFINLNSIQRTNYSREKIQNSIKGTTGTMVIYILFYLLSNPFQIN